MKKNNSIELTDNGIDLLSSSYNDPSFFIIPDMGSELADLDKSDLSEAKKTEKRNEIMRDFSIKSERIHTVNQLLRAYSMFEKMWSMW